MPPAPDFQQLLRDAGLRVTRPRLAVLDALVELPARRHGLGHRRRTRVTSPEVSHQAVYDSLRTLTTAGLARRIQPTGLGRPLRGPGRRQPPPPRVPLLRRHRRRRLRRRPRARA